MQIVSLQNIFCSKYIQTSALFSKNINKTIDLISVMIQINFRKEDYMFWKLKHFNQ